MDKYVTVTNEVKYAADSLFEITSCSVLARNDMHNAFPSLCQYQGALFTAFRRGTAHRGQADGVIIVARSDDQGKNWREIANIKTQHDMRDPQLFPVGDKLLLYSTGLYENPPEKVPARGRFTKYLYTYSSPDGVNFSEFKSSGLEENSFFWGCKPYMDGFVSTAYNASNSLLYFSKDAVNWQLFADLGEGNECSMTVDSKGELHCIVRRDTGDFTPRYCRVSRDGAVEKINIDLPMQGIMFESIGENFVLAARRWDWENDNKTNHRIDMFTMDRNAQLLWQCTLPSGGDCSYSKTLPLENGSFVMVYYSQHNYLQQLQQATHNQNLSVVKRSNDMYVCHWQCKKQA